MATQSHKRETYARRKPRAVTVAAPLAVLATASAVTIGVLASNPEPGNLLATKDSASISQVGSRDVVSRSQSRLAARQAQLEARVTEQRKQRKQRERRAVERAEQRAEQATLAAVREADTKRWTTTDLNLWTVSGADAKQVGVLEEGKRVLVTGRQADGRDEVVVDGQSRWVTQGYLSDEKPIAAAGGLSMAACPDSSVENGLTDSAVYVYRSVCHAFPQITSYGGWDGHGEHSSGKALDIMTSDKALGDEIAAFLQSHASELNLYDIIWWGRIWTPERASEGWRYYGDHGSATANHMDHVHVSTY